MIDEDDDLPVLTRVLRTGKRVRTMPPPNGIGERRDDPVAMSPSYASPLDFPQRPWTRDRGGSGDDSGRHSGGSDTDDSGGSEGSDGDGDGDAAATKAATLEASDVGDASTGPWSSGRRFQPDDGPDRIERSSDAVATGTPAAGMPTHAGVAEAPDSSSEFVVPPEADREADADATSAPAHADDDSSIGIDDRFSVEPEFDGPSVDLAPPAPDGVDGDMSDGATADIAARASASASRSGGSSGHGVRDVASNDALDVAAFDDASRPATSDDAADEPPLEARSDASTAATFEPSAAHRSSDVAAPDNTMFDEAAVGFGPSGDAPSDLAMRDVASIVAVPDADHALRIDVHGAADDTDRWHGLSERVRDAVLDDLGARVDTDFDARIAQVVHAEIETAVGRLQHALREHVADALRDVVARAIEAEVVRRRTTDERRERD